MKIDNERELARLRKEHQEGVDSRLKHFSKNFEDNKMKLRVELDKITAEAALLQAELKNKEQNQNVIE